MTQGKKVPPHHLSLRFVLYKRQVSQHSSVPTTPQVPAEALVAKDKGGVGGTPVLWHREMIFIFFTKNIFLMFTFERERERERERASTRVRASWGGAERGDTESQAGSRL